MRIRILPVALVAFSAKAAIAQHATQVVRFSVTGATQAAITSSSGTYAGGDTKSAGLSGESVGSAGFAAAPVASASSAPVVALAQQALPPKPRYDSAGRTVAAHQEVSVPIWQASIAITNSEDNKKVTVSIDEPMPDGVQLTLELGASRGAETAGMVVLGTGGTDAMTSMPRGNAAPIPLGVGIASAPGAGQNAGPRKLSFTLITGA